MIAALPWERVGKHLCMIRRRTWPACPDIAAFTALLDNNQVVRQEFAYFRALPFYVGSFHVQEDTISLFMLRQISDELPNQCELYMDTTFSILPLQFTNFFLVFGVVAGNYSLYFFS